MKEALPYLIAGIALLGVVLAGVAVAGRVRRVVRGWISQINLMRAMAVSEEQLAATPKSVSSMTDTYLPLIEKDFPTFNFEEFCRHAEMTLQSVFAALDQGEVTGLEGASQQLIDQVRGEMSHARSMGRQACYRDVTFYQTEIVRYIKRGGTCTIRMQTALSYFHYMMEGQRVVEGRKDLPVQTRYETDWVYVQDVSKMEGAYQDGGVGLRCPGCGAPVTSLGQKVCAYCGGAVVPAHLFVWHINRYKKV
nr:zinc-ribbon domain-containing transport protein [bacterium]